MQKHNKDIYLIGAGGHAKVILALLEAQGRKCLGIYDDNEQRHGTTLLDVPIVGAVRKMPDRCNISTVIAIGDNSTRKRIAESFRNIHWAMLIPPHSWVHSSVKIEEGTVVFVGAVIQPDTHIAKHTIINTSTSVGHDYRIGDSCHIVPGCHLADGVTVGDNTFVCVGVEISPGISIAAGITIGAGSVVVKHITTGGVYLGVPAVHNSKTR